MGTNPVLERIASAECRLASLETCSHQLADPHPLLAETLHEFAATLKDLRTLEEQAEAECAGLQAIIQNCPEGIVAIDDAAHVVLANQAAERIYGRALPYDTASPELAEAVHGYVNGQPYTPPDLPLSRGVQRGERLHNAELTIRRPDGQQRVLSIHAAPLADPQSPVHGTVEVLQDITQRKRIDQMRRRRVRDLRLLNRFGRELTASLEVGQVLDRVLAAMQQLVHAQGACIWLRDEEHPGWLVCRACVGFVEATLLNRRMHPEEGILGRVVPAGKSIVLQNVDTGIDQSVDDWLGPSVGSILAVPLHARQHVTGALVVARDGTACFTAYDRSLLEALASAATIAIENAQLHGEAQRSAAAAERTRLARELHDAVSQTLFSASVIAETLTRVWDRDPGQVKAGVIQLQQLTRGALAEMRSLLLELRPSALLETSLGDLLKHLTEAVSGRSNIKPSLVIDSARTLPPEAHIALYRIAQEALNNAVKHSRATHVVVSLFDTRDGVGLCIRDNGRGFDTGEVSPEHLGLGIMRERALSLGMNLTVTSANHRGTEIVVNWPGGVEQEER